MLIALECVLMCFLLLITCAVAIANGPIGGVCFYEKDVQKRVIEMGLISEKNLKKRSIIILIILLIPLLVFVPLMVYFLNGARGFLECFWQMSVILVVDGLFDRLFIDYFWVTKSKAWIIPGTEDLMPYIPKKTWIKKWLGVFVVYPELAALLALILSAF